MCSVALHYLQAANPYTSLRQIGEIFTTFDLLVNATDLYKLEHVGQSHTLPDWNVNRISIKNCEMKNENEETQKNENRTNPTLNGIKGALNSPNSLLNVN